VSEKLRVVPRRDFIVGSAAVAAGVAACAGAKPSPKPHRWIDESRCIGCGACVPLCPMGAIALDEVKGFSAINPVECAECGVCWRSRVCPVDALTPGALAWPRTLRETFSNPLTGHKSTGVPGRGTEGIKTNDTTHRYQRGFFGVFVELGRPVLGARFRDVERVVKKFRSGGFTVQEDNPVHELVADSATGALQPEALDEKVVSALIEFVLPESAVGWLQAALAELAMEVDTVFNVSIALRAGPDGASPLSRLFGPEQFSLPNGKMNLGLAEGIAGKEM